MKFCSVPGCKKKTNKGQKFPKDSELRKKWIRAIVEETKNELWLPKDSSMICENHFKADDFRRESSSKSDTESEEDGKNDDILKPGIVPSIFEKGTRSVGVQTQSPFSVTGHMNIFIVRDQPEVIKYFTGFEDYRHFLNFYHYLGEDVLRGQDEASLVNFKSVTLYPQNELYLTLIKVLHDKPDQELAIIFGIEEPIVRKICYLWQNLLFLRLRDLKPAEGFYNEYDESPAKYVAAVLKKFKHCFLDDSH